MMKTLISAASLTVSRQQKNILHNVSLDIGDNDFITIVGPNGAGKTMLIKALMGFYPLSSGHINRQQNLRIGYIPQRFNPHTAMPITAKRFLTLNTNPQLCDLATIVAATQIAPLMNKMLHDCSGGEMQRLLLARALLNKPQLLILDEPTQNLDVPGQLAFYQLLERIYQQQRLSVLMVSHDLHMVMRGTKKVICLFHHICCSGTPNVVAKDPEFISLFGKDMANWVSVYHHEHDHSHDKGIS